MPALLEVCVGRESLGRFERVLIRCEAYDLPLESLGQRDGLAGNRFAVALDLNDKFVGIDDELVRALSGRFCVSMTTFLPFYDQIPHGPIVIKHLFELFLAEPTSRSIVGRLYRQGGCYKTDRN